MTSAHDSSAAAAHAVERVLRAERQAEADIAAAERDAQALLAAAREDALATVNRAIARIARWQQAHAAAVQARLDLRRRSAAAQAQPAPDAGRLHAAAQQVAALLTGGSAGR